MTNKLAIYGGKPLREKPFPCRQQFGKEELSQVTRVFEESWKNEKDFSFQGKFEKLYTDQFCQYQGGKGYADAVSSGTAAVFIALASLNLPVGCDVIFSPVTDPGGINPAIILGHSPVIADSQKDSYNTGVDEFLAAVTPDTKAAVITHVGGLPADIEPIVEAAANKGISVIEDCSQAHGAKINGKKVGCFGSISAFSTMFSKNHSTGGCGGVVYTRDQNLYHLALSLADRGKPLSDTDFDPKNPGDFIFPALNFNQDEISCAIGISTLAKLDMTIQKRIEIMDCINNNLARCRSVKPIRIDANLDPSPFFLTVKVENSLLKVSKTDFAKALIAEGMWVNPDYRYVVSDWPWLQKYTNKMPTTPNAGKFRDETFNILFNENFTANDIEDIISCILKVEEELLD